MDVNKFPFGIVNFDIVLNKNCNANCSYCRIKANHSSFKDLEMSEQILDEFYERLLNNPPNSSEYYNINLDETEPLISFQLIKKIFKKYSIKRDNRFFHSITTNGKLLDEEIIKFCEDNSIVLKISIDGTPENCFNEKGVNIEQILQKCRKMKKRNLICFSYVISQKRLPFLEEDLQCLYNYYCDCGGEYSFLIDTISPWEESVLFETISRVKKFLIAHYKTSNLFFKPKTDSRYNTGLKLEIDGTLSFWPMNKSCQDPIDLNFPFLGTECGTISQPNNDKIKKFIDVYGLNYCNTNPKSEYCKHCESKKDCQYSNVKTYFIFSKNDCQNHRFHFILRREIEKLNIHYEEIKDKFRLTGICLNLTDKCNMRCKYCFARHKPQEMTLDTAKAAVMWVKANQGDSSNTHINFFGGEPMLKYDEIIVPLIEWVEKMGIEKISFGLTTNGTLFTKERIDWLSEHGLSLLLSIDGGPKTQNENRILVNGEDSFLKVVENIPYLLSKYPDLTFRSTLTAKNTQDMFENYLWAKELGFQNYYLMANEFEEWTFDDLKKMSEGLFRIYWEMYQNICNNIPTPIITHFFQTFLKIFGISSISMEAPYMRCGLGTTSVGIGVNGEIFGCQEHDSYDSESIFYLGNIFKDGIEKNRHIRLLESYMQGDIDSFYACPSHCYGVNKDLTKVTEVHSVWDNVTKNSIKEILLDAAKNNNLKLIEFIKENGSRWT